MREAREMPMPLRRAATAALLLALAGPAGAQPLAAPCLPAGGDVTSVAKFAGRCTRALHEGVDRTPACGGTVTGVGYRGGRSGFAFELAAGVTVTFTGLEGQADGPVLKFKVDTLTSGKGAAPVKTAVRGACVLDATDKAAARIACAIPEAGRETRYEFVASGKPEHWKTCPPDEKKPAP